MEIKPLIFEAPSALRACPGCGSKDYVVETHTEDGEASCVGLTCSACGLDILHVYSWLKSLERPKRPPMLSMTALRQFLTILFGG